MSMRPPSSLGSMPWRTAFSTSVSRVIGGQRRPAPQVDVHRELQAIGHAHLHQLEVRPHQLQLALDRRVSTAAEMAEAVFKHSESQDILIMAAAVADYTPLNPATEKIKKSGESITVEFTKTTDILSELGRKKKPGQILVGFALRLRMKRKMHAKSGCNKNLDYIVLNSLRDEGAGFGHDTNKITILDAQGKVHRYPLHSKTETARNILMRIADDYGWS